MDFWKSVAGKTGHAIDILGKAAERGFLGPGAWALGKAIGEHNLSESLQSYGGAPGGWVWVKPAQAAEPQPSGGSVQPPPNTSVMDTKSLLRQPASPPPSQPSGGGGGNQMDQLVNAMVQRGGYDPTTARQVAGADFNRFWNEFMGSGSGGGQPSGPSPEEIALQKAQQAFHAAYEPIYNYLDQLAGNLPKWRQEKEQNLQKLFEAQKGEITAAEQGALAKFPQYREQVRQQQVKSVRDLANQMRQMLHAGAIYLGTGGAASSSATPMYAAALSKAAARGRADIIRQAQQEYNDINMKEADIKNTYQQQLAKLGTWKAQQLSNIADWYQQQQQQLEQMKAQATSEEKQAIAARQAELVNAALNRLNALDQEARQWENGMRSWAIQRLAEIDNLKAQYPQLARWQPQEISIPQLKTLAGLAPSQSEAAWWNPALIRKKKEEERLTNWLNRM